MSELSDMCDMYGALLVKYEDINQRFHCFIMHVQASIAIHINTG